MADTIEGSDNCQGEKEKNGRGLETVSYVLLSPTVHFFFLGGGGGACYILSPPPAKKKISNVEKSFLIRWLNNFGDFKFEF